MRDTIYVKTARTSGTLPSFQVGKLGKAAYQNFYDAEHIVQEDRAILVDPSDCKGEWVELAGPRRMLYFDPRQTNVGIVTCGGLCPGINNVIRALVMCLHYRFGVPRIVGFRFGFAGLVPKFSESVDLTPALVQDIHLVGGTILGTSRGQQDPVEMVEFLHLRQIDVLFVIGGDGSMRGAMELVKEIDKRKFRIAIIGIPKTIDNDIGYTDRTFGFGTAIEMAQASIHAVHREAQGAKGGIGVVKLMGRDAGFIALHSSLASGDVNVVLIPEIHFSMKKLLRHLEYRIKVRGHVVLVTAEGAGQHFLKDLPDRYDRSGNRLQKDIGPFLVSNIDKYMKSKHLPHTIKYIDPSYTLRGAPANPSDALFCICLANNAVHAALSGRTGVVICHHNNLFVHVPIERAAHFAKRLDPSGPLFRIFMDNSGMPDLSDPKYEAIQPVDVNGEAQGTGNTLETVQAKL